MPGGTRKKSQDRHRSREIPAAAQASYAALEDEAKHILDSIDQLRCQLAEVRARQNALVPINSVPDETLLGIFALLVEPVVIRNIQRIDNSDHFGVVTVSHVCARWRSVAIHNPALWTEIPLYSLKQANIFAVRSRPMPVRVALDYLSKQNRVEEKIDFGKVLGHLTPRLRALSISNVYPYEDMAWWTNRLQRAAPLLEELTLALDRHRNEIIPGFTIFANTPALRYMTLYKVSASSASPLFRNLRHLHLLSQAAMMLSLPKLLRILRRLPDLETLVLKEIEPDVNDSADTTGPEDEDVGGAAQITLARLSSLKIADVPEGWHSRILRQLILPVDASLDLDFASDYEDWLFLCLDHLPRGLRSLEGIFISRSDPSITLRAGRDTSSVSPETLRAHAWNDFELELWIESVSALMDTTAVESYTISIVGMPLRAPMRTVDWRQALRRFCALKTLRVISTHLPDLSILIPLMRELASRPDASEEFLCPMLESLELNLRSCTQSVSASLEEMVRKRCAVANSPFKHISITVEPRGELFGKSRARKLRAVLRDFEVVRAGAS